jgi:hypothetical protein
MIAKGKGSGLFVPYVYPVEILPTANRIRDAVQRVSGNSVHAFHSRLSENIHEQVGDIFLGHILNPSFFILSSVSP